MMTFTSQKKVWCLHVKGRDPLAVFRRVLLSQGRFYFLPAPVQRLGKWQGLPRASPGSRFGPPPGGSGLIRLCWHLVAVLCAVGVSAAEEVSSVTLFLSFVHQSICKL